MVTASIIHVICVNGGWIQQTFRFGKQKQNSAINYNEY